MTYIVIHLLYFLFAFLGFYFANIIHELSHFALFRFFRIKVTSLNLGLFSVMFINDKAKLKLHPLKIFTASCTCKFDKNISCYKYVISLLAGSLSCLILSLILFFLQGHIQNLVFSRCLLIIGFFCLINFIVNYATPFSEDRKLTKYVIESFNERSR